MPNPAPDSPTPRPLHKGGDNVGGNKTVTQTAVFADGWFPLYSSPFQP